MDKFIARLKLIGKEIMNFITNIIVPLIPIVMVILEICGVPKSTLEKIKEIEYKLFEAFGTEEDLKK